MNRVLLGVSLAFLAASATFHAQTTSIRSGAQPALFASAAFLDLMGGAGGGGQAEPTAIRNEAFTRATLGVTVSPLGIGPQAGTNLGPRVDTRLFGNYLSLTHNFTQSGFNIDLNLNMVNTGAKVDFYPGLRFPVRITPGFLYFNQNRIRADLRAAERGATFTLNNVDYMSDPSNPIHGTGRLRLGGTGFLITTGWGHIISHTRKRFTYPFELGVVFIDTPKVDFYLFGNVCQVHGTNCQPAATFPTFSSNLAAQVKSWNNRVQPFHVYPILEGGVAYSFSIHRRDIY